MLRKLPVLQHPPSYPCSRRHLHVFRREYRHELTTMGDPQLHHLDLCHGPHPAEGYMNATYPSADPRPASLHMGACVPFP